MKAFWSMAFQFRKADQMFYCLQGRIHIDKGIACNELAVIEAQCRLNTQYRIVIVPLRMRQAPARRERYAKVPTYAHFETHAVSEQFASVSYALAPFWKGTISAPA